VDKEYTRQVPLDIEKRFMYYVGKIDSTAAHYKELLGLMNRYISVVKSTSMDFDRFGSVLKYCYLEFCLHHLGHWQAWT
jgi:hypothetical protein